MSPAPFEEVIGALEGGHAVAFASGMAAVRAVLELVGPGERVVAPSGAYSGTRQLLAALASCGRLECALADVTDSDAVLQAVASPGAGLLWVESPTNPMMGLADLPALASSGARFYAVDNTFATPMVQRPLSLGADVVVHSATKLLSGHSDVLLGVAVARDPSVADALRAVRTDYGMAPGAAELFLAHEGVRTLPLRFERASATASSLAARLASHPAVERVLYPGFGTMLSFLARGGAAAADRFCASVRVAVPATSLGGVETLAERRAHYALEVEAGVPASLVRVSVGVEDAEDLWADVSAALDAAQAVKPPDRASRRR
jgi:cystathionine gamma-synthase